MSGHLGKFTLSLHWLNLGSQPVDILIEHGYLLVVPQQEIVDAEEEEQRAQASKMERLESAELLYMRSQANVSSSSSGEEISQSISNAVHLAHLGNEAQSQGLLA